MLQKKESLIKNKFVYFENFLNEGVKELVVIISGISGGMESPLVKDAFSFFIKKYNVVKINFCNDNFFKREDCPDVREVTMNSFVHDFKTVLLEFLGKNQNITLIGHSFSVPVILSTLPSLNDDRIKIVLWDGTILNELYFDIKKYFNHNDSLREYYDIKSNNKDFVFTDLFLESFRQQPDPFDCISNVKNKILIIGAEKGGMEASRKYFQKIQQNHHSKLEIIKDAGHLFGNRLSRKTLFNYTLSFIENQDL